MKNYELWVSSNADVNSDRKNLLLIEPNKIEDDVVWADNIIYTKKEGIDGYIKVISEYDGTLEDYLKDNNTDYGYCKEYETKESLKIIEEDGDVLFDTYTKEIVKAMDFEYQKRYSWWDGHNWRYVYADDTEKKISISDDRVCLDEWDGRNWYTAYPYYHEYVYRLINVDGELVDDEFLIIESSQYQESHVTASIYTRSELKLHLEELNRNVKNLMKKIDAIEIK